MFETNNNYFKKDIETSFKEEVIEQLQLNNLAFTENFNQSFVSFQAFMLQTIK